MGYVALVSQLIGFAIKLAVDSGLSSARRLGTSSPMMTEAAVMAVMTIAVAMTSACSPVTGHCESDAERRCATVASPNAPLVMPITVMPTCMVDGKFAGLLLSSSAAPAPRRPSSAHCCSRALREDTTASSDRANTPFNTMRSVKARISIVNVAQLHASARA